MATLQGSDCSAPSSGAAQMPDSWLHCLSPPSRPHAAGRADLLQDMCSDLSSVPGVTTWAVRSHSPSEAQRGPDKTR